MEGGLVGEGRWSAGRSVAVLAADGERGSEAECVTAAPASACVCVVVSSTPAEAETNEFGCSISMV